LIEIIINDGIKALTVNVVDNTNKFLGKMATSDAIKLAESKDLDLIEVSASPTVPTCKIMKYDSYRFSLIQKEKLAKKNQKVEVLKEIKIKLNIADNDLGVKVRHILSFLADGNKVKISIPLKGRELAHRDVGFAMLSRVMSMFNNYNVEASPNMEGKTIYSIITNKK
jgi:translation initiation factor IF-3